MPSKTKKLKPVPLADAEKFDEFVSEFQDESDRAAVVLGAAKLDLLLYQILQKVFVATAGSRDELLDGDSPLGTFSSKISIAHRLGLVSPSFARSLHLIRKIRNSFAHELSSKSLSSGSHSDRTKELVVAFGGDGRFREIKNIMYPDDNSDSALFRTCLAALVARLEHLLHNAQPLSDEDAYQLLPGGVKHEEDNSHPPMVVDDKA